jgi:hypothetical protein
MHSAVAISWQGKKIKKIQESLHSEEDYQEDNKIGKIKKGDNFSGTYVLFRGLSSKIREEW